MAEFHLPLSQSPNFTTAEIDGSHYPAEDFLETGDEIDGDYIAYLNYLDSRSDPIETYSYYDDVFSGFFGVFASPARGFNSPAMVSEELPVAELTTEELRERDLAICAVCLEEFVASEKLSELPCGHYYHKECIVPRLMTRNTCPICRRELPTDAAEEG
ncbi:PREDICTED: E3 ubiquitin-protein ligase RING1 [Tarenaya hassleriana]|uniref:E3 ubiquitin-protein ligase RING1 n=1 Tax=Tarenaya hassleriana TaxID=28532 RepID=UPI00053C53FE|nr:PREDICTED: E3 ubiquitin-protein ligase RING1 [Tarenaya hassleriana]